MADMSVAKVLQQEGGPPQVLLLHLSWKLLCIRVETTQTEIRLHSSQHREDDGSLVEVKASVGGALLEPPEGERRSTVPAEPVRKLNKGASVEDETNL